MRLLTTLAFLFISGTSFANDYCSESNMNTLVWLPEFQNEIKEYFGDQKEELFWDTKISEQVLSVLGGPPDNIRKTSETTAIGSACRAHSCDEKAAVLIECPSNILAVGLIHYMKDGELSEFPHLTVFRISNDITAQSKYTLEKWATDATKSMERPLVTIQYK